MTYTMWVISTKSYIKNLKLRFYSLTWVAGIVIQGAMLCHPKCNVENNKGITLCLSLNTNSVRTKSISDFLVAYAYLSKLSTFFRPGTKLQDNSNRKDRKQSLLENLVAKTSHMPNSSRFCFKPHFHRAYNIFLQLPYNPITSGIHLTQKNWALYNGNLAVPRSNTHPRFSLCQLAFQLRALKFRQAWLLSINHKHEMHNFNHLRILRDLRQLNDTKSRMIKLMLPKLERCGIHEDARF